MQSCAVSGFFTAEDAENAEIKMGLGALGVLSGNLFPHPANRVTADHSQNTRGLSWRYLTGHKNRRNNGAIFYGPPRVRASWP